MRVKAISRTETTSVPAGGNASQTYKIDFQVNKITITTGVNTSVTALTVSGKSYPAGTTAVNVTADFGSPAEVEVSVSLSNAGTAAEDTTIVFDGITR